MLDRILHADTSISKVLKSDSNCLANLSIKERSDPAIVTEFCLRAMQIFLEEPNSGLIVAYDYLLLGV